MTSIFQKIAELEARAEIAALCTIIESKGSTPRHQSSKMIVYPDRTIFGSVGGGEIENRVIQEAIGVMTDLDPKLVYYKLNDPQAGDPGICGGQVTVYIEPIGKKDRVIIIGAGHVGKAVAKLAKWLGYYVIVSDDRSEWCNSTFIPDADQFVVDQMSSLPSFVDIRKSDCLILTTRGSDIDVEGLPELLKNRPFYIGIIGSKRRWLLTQKRLLEAGMPKEKLATINSPIGLELRAETPEEIAVSIMAEIIMLRNKGSGKTMKFKGEG